MAEPGADAPDAADQRRLIERLSEMGATSEELEEASRTGSLGPLALDLALRGPGEVIAFEEAARQAGLEPDAAARTWRALGFPDPRDPPLMVTPRRIETLRVLSQMSRALLGPDTSLQLARVLGSSVAQLAEAIVDAFRIRVEMPARDQGQPSSQVVDDYARTAAAMIPALTDAIGDILAGHLVTVSRANWALDEQRVAITRDLVIGFADLVEYTRTARGLAPAELTDAIGRFESRVGEIVPRYGGRVVKLIGDEIMFVLPDPASATPLALELARELARDPELPAVRIGLAAGPVVSHAGDYYGDVVNLAARLVKAADPGSALMTESLSGRTGDVEPVELPLKGYDTPVRAWRLPLR